MRFLVASDLHGDSYWTERVIKAFNDEKADKLVLLGDILYHGPRNDLPSHYEPKKVISLLNSMASSILAVRGNCDTEVDQMVLKFPILADYIYLVSGETTFFATHGHNIGPHRLPACLPENSVLLAGHTHVVCDQTVTDPESGLTVRYMNPGSPSIPKEGKTLLPLLAQYEPYDLCVIMLGSNDLLTGADAKETGQRMKAFLKDLADQNDRLLLVSPVPFRQGEWVSSEAQIRESKRLAEEYRKIAGELGIRFADAADWNVTLSYDGVHYLPEGHAAFAKGITIAINEMSCQ